MGDACRALNTPVTGGNVSFYNENPESAIFPTPIIGMLGVIEDVEKHKMSPSFKQEGDVVMYIGAPRSGIGGSEYLKVIHGLTTGDAPELDLDVELRVQQTVLEAIQGGMVTAAHDVSDGGLATCLAEMAIFGKKGAQVDLSVLKGDTIELWFSEAQSGIVVTCTADQKETLLTHCNAHGVPAVELGVVGGTSLHFKDSGELAVDHAQDVYESVLPNAMA
jgi:phosphoribosylformylglycinamidine synthase